jgi:hypothetical protein
MRTVCIVSPAPIGCEGTPPAAEGETSIICDEPRGGAGAVGGPPS